MKRGDIVTVPHSETGKPHDVKLIKRFEMPADLEPVWIGTVVNPVAAAFKIKPIAEIFESEIIAVNGVSI